MGESSLTNTRVLQRNPFPGIRSFTSAEDKFFFGRETTVAEVLDLIKTYRFCALVGPSGSGKTSLIQSGIIPELLTDKKQEWIPITVRPGPNPLESLVRGFQQVFPHHITESDVETFLSSSQDLGDLISGKDLEGHNFYLVVDQFEELFISWPTVRKKKKNGRHPDTTRLVDLLIRAVESEKPSIYVTISIRSDYMDACSLYRSLAEKMNRSKYLLTPMTRAALSKAIIGPIHLAGARVESGFEEYLLDDLEEVEIQLPMLQHALKRTWEFWIHQGYMDKPITISDYQSIGTLKNAIGDHLEEAYQELNQFQKEICERLFKSITYKGEQNDVFRRQSPLNTIARIAQCTVEELIDVVEVFRRQERAFIAPHVPVALSPESKIELAHESLVALWPRLKEWVDEEADSILMYMKLSEASALYQQGRTELWKPPELQQAIIWKNTQKPSPAWGVQYNPAFERAMVFLGTSEEEYAWEQERKIILQKRKLILNRAITVFLGVLVVVLAIVFLTNRNRVPEQPDQVAEQEPAYIPDDQTPAYTAPDDYRQLGAEDETAEQEQLQTEEEIQGGQGVEGESGIPRMEENRPPEPREEQSQVTARQQRQTEQQRQESTPPPVRETPRTVPVRQERTNTNNTERADMETRRKALDMAALVASQSVNIDRNPELEGLLAYQAYKIHTRNNGNRYDAVIYHGLYQAMKKLISPAYNIYPNLRSSVKAIKWLNRSASILVVSSDGSVKILAGNVANRSSQITLKGTGLNNECLTVSPDERIAAVGTNGGGLLFLELENQGEVVHTSKEQGNIVLFLQNLGNSGSFISAGTENRIIKWEYEGFGSTTLVATSARPSALAASSDGRKVAYGTRDGKIFELDINAPDQVRQLNDVGSNHVTSLTYSPDNQRLIAGMLNGTLRVMRGTGRQLEYTLRGPGSRVSDLAYSPDGRFLAAASNDGNVYLWNTSDWESQPLVFSENNGFVLAVCFNGNSSYFYSGSVDYPRLVGRPSEAAQMASDFCSLVGRNLTTEEWVQYFDGDLPYEETCPGLNQ